MSWPAGPPRPPAPRAELHVWRAELDAPGWPSAQALPDDERERAARFLREDAGRRWVAARWALRSVLARYVAEEPARLSLATGPHGKPALAGIADPPRFNFSHSGGHALVAVATGVEVGVDVEVIKPDRDVAALAARALDPDAAAAVRSAPEEARAALFHAAWVRREAVAKCLGVGLFAPLPDAPVAVADLDAGAGCAAAVAVAGAVLPAIRRWTIDVR